MTSTNTLPRVSGAEVRARLGEPEAMIKAKIGGHIDRHARRFIAHSPFLTLATADAAGRADCSPRGDYPGFVKVLDEHTLALPDRPGNKIAEQRPPVRGAQRRDVPHRQPTAAQQRRQHDVA
ncbi:pyridoxamine 5'-phosphate oxidase family protein, partial [Amycolatopsis sp. NPDC003731]